MAPRKNAKGGGGNSSSSGSGSGSGSGSPSTGSSGSSSSPGARREENTQEAPQMKKSLSEKVSLYRGDITLLEVDAIVNAANASLLGGGGDVIHTVGPIARGHINGSHKEDLANCYQSSLKLVKENNLRSVYPGLRFRVRRSVHESEIRSLATVGLWGPYSSLLLSPAFQQAFMVFRMSLRQSLP